MTRYFTKKAVFLDRDGTINEDPGYLSDPAALRLLPGVGEGLARIQRLGFDLVVVSNQSGIARGLIRPDQLEAIHERLQELLRPFGAEIARFELCTHHPEEACDCRKPSPELLYRGMRAGSYELSECFMIGDKFTDIQAGINAGVRETFLVRSGDGTKAEKEALCSFPGVRVFDDLPQIANWIEKLISSKQTEAS